MPRNSREVIGTDSPTITVARPRKINMPARVVMKPGMPMTATQKPCQTPTIRPTTRAMTMASIQMTPARSISSAHTPPMKATKEPTERSMWVAMMTITIPMARMIT